MYLDYNATYPLRDSCKELIRELLKEDFKNPSGVYTEGRYAKSKINNAKKKLSDYTGMSVDQIFWTSGATEANNILLKGYNK